MAPNWKAKHTVEVLQSTDSIGLSFHIHEPSWEEIVRFQGKHSLIQAIISIVTICYFDHY